MRAPHGPPDAASVMAEDLDRLETTRTLRCRFDRGAEAAARGCIAAEGATPIPPGISCPATREQAPAEVRGGRGRACAMPRWRSPAGARWSTPERRGRLSQWYALAVGQEFQSVRPELACWREVAVERLAGDPELGT